MLALIHHLDLPVEIVALSVEDVQSDTFAAINPNRLAPALVDGDLTLWEFNAIGIHLAQGSAMLPSGPRLQSDMLRWLFWESTHFNKALGTIFLKSVVRPQLGWGAGNRALIDDALEQAEKYLAVLDTHLKDRPFMLGEKLLASSTSQSLPPSPIAIGWRSISTGLQTSSAIMTSLRNCPPGRKRWEGPRPLRRPDRPLRYARDRFLLS